MTRRWLAPASSVAMLLLGCRSDIPMDALLVDDDAVEAQRRADEIDGPDEWRAFEQGSDSLGFVGLRAGELVRVLRVRESSDGAGTTIELETDSQRAVVSVDAVGALADGDDADVDAILDTALALIEDLERESALTATGPPTSRSDGAEDDLTTPVLGTNPDLVFPNGAVNSRPFVCLVRGMRVRLAAATAAVVVAAAILIRIRGSGAALERAIVAAWGGAMGAILLYAESDDIGQRVSLVDRAKLVLENPAWRSAVFGDIGDRYCGAGKEVHFDVRGGANALGPAGGTIQIRVSRPIDNDFFATHRAIVVRGGGRNGECYSTQMRSFCADFGFSAEWTRTISPATLGARHSAFLGGEWVSIEIPATSGSAIGPTTGRDVGGASRRAAERASAPTIVIAHPLASVYANHLGNTDP